MNTLEVQMSLRRIHPSLQSNVYPSNRLPLYAQVPALIICNLDPDSQPGSHWVAIHINVERVGEYFDSFGRKPIEAIEGFLRRNCCMWRYNSVTVQDYLSAVCGEYCLVYVYYKFKGMRLEDFLGNFTSDSANNDMVLVNLYRNIMDM